MDFSTAIKAAFAKYATFHGRASRAEYWLFTLFTLLASAATGILDLALFPGQESLSPLNSIFILAILVPAASCSARRLHDINRSGWWQLMWLLPVIGWILLLVWTCTRGDEGDNRFGPSPYAQPAPSPAGARV